MPSYKTKRNRLGRAISKKRAGSEKKRKSKEAWAPSHDLTSRPPTPKVAPSMATPEQAWAPRHDLTSQGFGHGGPVRGVGKAIRGHGRGKIV